MEWEWEYRMGMSIRIAQLNKWKVFGVNSKNIKQTISIQETFIFENKLQKKKFLAKYDHFFIR